jgi:protein TonB
MLVISVALHVGVAAALLLTSDRRQQRRAIAMSFFEPKKAPKLEEKPKLEAPPPPPVKKARPAAAVAKDAAPTAAQPPPPVAPPVDTGLVLGDSEGISLPAAPGSAQAPSPDKKPAAATKKNASHHDPQAPNKEKEKPAAEECSDEPTRPEPLSRTEIEYTAAARASGVEGRLVIRVTVDADGTVVKAEVISSVDPALDAAAVAAVERWRFKPALRCGKPVAGGVYTLARRFELGD